MATALLKLTDVQLGSSVTATNNFTIYQPATPDGTVRWGVGNSGSVTDIVTLNSSGYVGIGTSSPAEKLTVSGSASVSSDLILKESTTARGYIFGTSAGLTYRAASVPHVWQNGGTEQMRLDASGNLGLGVTPSAWSLWGSVLQGNAYSITGYNSGGNVQSQFWMNSYRHSSGNPYYVSNGAASSYAQSNGTHYWNIAPSGTAGNAITFTQAMTLDASGNLGVGTSSPVSNGGYGGLTLNGTNGSIFSLSTAGTEGTRLYNGGNETSLQCKASSGYITFVQGLSGGSERMRIDSSGNVGIGTNSIDNIGNSGNKVLEIYGGANAPWIHFTNSTTGQASGDGLLVGVSGSDAYLIQRESANMIFRTADTERMRIDSSGNLLVGTTSQPVATYKQVIHYSAGSSTGGLMFNDTDSGVTYEACYFRKDGSQRGYIRVTTSGTSYNTVSDYRLKENIQPMQNALAVVQQLNPVTYTWKADGSDGQGFIAHELQAVVPDCVTGEKDAEDEDGNPVYQGIDTSFLVATLTAAIQEQQAIIESLTKRIETLEGA